jgi:hypothetical protein
VLYRDDFESSNIKAIAYEEDVQVLYVTFKSAAVYRYMAVPESVVAELLAAPSQGQYFSANIRGVYPTRHLKPEEIEQLMRHVNTEATKHNGAWLHSVLSIARLSGYREVLF